MRTATALAALVLALGTGLSQPAQAQQDPLSQFLRALAADLDRATSQGFGSHSDDRDDDDDDAGDDYDDDNDDEGSDDSDDDNDNDDEGSDDSDDDNDD